MSLKNSFKTIVELRNKLEHLHRRHVNYLDSLPEFMDLLSLQGAQTDEMVPLIYPYFSLYSDIKDNSIYGNLSEFANHLLSKLERYDLTKIKNDVIKLLYNLNIVVSPSNGNEKIAEKKREKNDFKKTGRNEKCPCGSGKKFKHCHGNV